MMKKAHGLTTRITPEFCCVELLSDKFQAESFDIVHMRNSLDHSFNVMLGIAQMLYVTRTGGKVILVHLDNVAEDANYEGLHQWNLIVRDGRFIVGRGEREFDVGEVFRRYVDIECTPSGKDRYHTVVLTKKNSIPLIVDPNKSLFVESLMSSLIHCLYEKVKREEIIPLRVCRKLKRILLRK